MKNGIAVLIAPVPLPAHRGTTLGNPIALACLAAALVAVAGCERVSVPPPLPQARAVADTGSVAERRRVDPARQRVWILNADGVFFRDSDTPENLVEIGLPSWQWADAPYGPLPDLALGPDGEAVVTSNVIPVLWRIDPETLAVTRHELVLDADQDKDVGFSSLVYSAQHEAFFAVSHAQGSLWQIDRLLRTGRKLSLPGPIRNAFDYRVNADTRSTQGISPKFCIVRPNAVPQHPAGHPKGMQS